MDFLLFFKTYKWENMKILFELLFNRQEGEDKI